MQEQNVTGGCGEPYRVQKVTSVFELHIFDDEKVVHVYVPNAHHMKYIPARAALELENALEDLKEQGYTYE